MITITSHALERLRDRVGVKTEAGAKDIASKAYRLGLEYSKEEESDKGDRYVKYEGFLFVFLSKHLLTVRPLHKEELGNERRRRDARGGRFGKPTKGRHNN